MGVDARDGGDVCMRAEASYETSRSRPVLRVRLIAENEAENAILLLCEHQSPSFTPDLADEPVIAIAGDFELYRSF